MTSSFSGGPERDGLEADYRFPFGARSTARPPRLPRGERARVTIVGVYPSALHVRWNLPRWAVKSLSLPEIVGALAIDVEPVVFWDGHDPDPWTLVERWKEQTGFAAGDEAGKHGNVRSIMNGTSGRAVTDRVLSPLGVEPDDVFFTDVVTNYFVKFGSKSRPQQGDRVRDVYEPFAAAASLPGARLPARPSPRQLVEFASRHERDRLRAELAGGGAPILITLGEEARIVINDIVDESAGPPTQTLRSDDPQYATPGRLVVNDYEATWMALTHPGNRSTTWSEARKRWTSQAARHRALSKR